MDKKKAKAQKTDIKLGLLCPSLCSFMRTLRSLWEKTSWTIRNHDTKDYNHTIKFTNLTHTVRELQ